MSDFVTGLLVGLFAGAIIGVFVMCLCVAASHEDRKRERAEQSNQQQSNQQQISDHVIACKNCYNYHPRDKRKGFCEIDGTMVKAYHYEENCRRRQRAIKKRKKAEKRE